MGGESRKVAHGLEKFNCRKIERNWVSCGWAGERGSKAIQRIVLLGGWLKCGGGAEWGDMRV